MLVPEILAEAKMSVHEAGPNAVAQHLMRLYFSDPRHTDFAGLNAVMNTLAHGGKAEQAVANAIFGAQIAGNFQGDYEATAAAYRSGKL